MISFLLALLSFAVISRGVLDCIACTYDCVYVMVAHIIEHFLKQIKIEYISFVAAAVEHIHKRIQGSYTYDYYYACYYY